MVQNRVFGHIRGTPDLGSRDTGILGCPKSVLFGPDQVTGLDVVWSGFGPFGIPQNMVKKGISWPETRNRRFLAKTWGHGFRRGLIGNGQSQKQQNDGFWGAHLGHGFRRHLIRIWTLFWTPKMAKMGYPISPFGDTLDVVWSQIRSLKVISNAKKPVLGR